MAQVKIGCNRIRYNDFKANLKKYNLKLERDLCYPKSEQEAQLIQNQLLRKFKAESADFDSFFFNNSNFFNSGAEESKKHFYICGTDVSYANVILQNEDGSEDFMELGVAAVVLYDIIEKKPIETKFAVGFVDFPYIPGLLAFREIPLIISTIKNLNTPNNFMTSISLILYDGHGIAHIKHFGAACQLGLQLGIPTIGVAKKIFFGKCAHSADELERKRGNYAFITDGDGKEIGIALVLQDKMKPVFVSPGFSPYPTFLKSDNISFYSMSENKSINYKNNLAKLLSRICLECAPKKASSRIPEPIFLADRYSRKMLNDLLQI